MQSSIVTDNDVPQTEPPPIGNCFPIANPGVVTENPSSAFYPNIRAIRLRIAARWKRPTRIPGSVLSNVLRGALGITLRKLVCPDGWLDNACPPCPLYEQCAYGQVFVPTPPSDAQQLRLQQDLPRPFVIEPDGLHAEDPNDDKSLTFRLMLFGTAIERLPYLISTLDRLGSDGLGRDRVPFTIERIISSHRTGDEALFMEGSNSVSLPGRFITTHDLISDPWPTEIEPQASSAEVRQKILTRMGLHTPPREQSAPANPARPRLKVRFLTPLLLKSGSGIAEDGKRISAQEIRDRPPFGIIIRRLRDRLSALCTFFGDRWDCPDFGALGSVADQVSIVDSQTTWLTRTRHSTRTGQSHEISGLVGHTTYEFPDELTLRFLSPLLRVGELIHVGKNAPWGNGAIGVRLLSIPSSLGEAGRP